MLSTAITDLDGDGLAEILLGPKEGDVLVIWGGPWVKARDFALAKTTTLPGGNHSTGFATADFDADGLLDIVRIAYGEAAPSIITGTAIRNRAPISEPTNAPAEIWSSASTEMSKKGRATNGTTARRTAAPITSRQRPRR